MITGYELKDFHARYGVSAEGLGLWLDVSFPENTTALCVDHSKNTNRFIQAIEAQRPALYTLAQGQRYYDCQQDGLTCAVPTGLNYDSNNFSLSFWIQNKNWAQAYCFPFSHTGGGITAGIGTYLIFDKLYIRTGSGASGAWVIFNYTFGSSYNWLFITIVFDIFSKTINLYVDSDYKETLAYSVVPTAISYPATISGRLWALQYSALKIGSLWFFNRKVCAEEIKRIYEVDRYKYGHIS